jgi:excisionase family DNA binding protein
MLTAADVAALLACSTKTVYRLADRGALPRPVRLGGLLRWRRGEIDQWIAEGCPARSRR